MTYKGTITKNAIKIFSIMQILPMHWNPIKIQPEAAFAKPLFYSDEGRKISPAEKDFTRLESAVFCH